MDGTLTLVDGILTLVDGTLTLVDGTLTLVDGILTLVDGTLTLTDWASQFHTERVRGLTKNLRAEHGSRHPPRLSRGRSHERSHYIHEFHVSHWTNQRMNTSHTVRAIRSLNSETTLSLTVRIQAQRILNR